VGLGLGSAATALLLALVTREAVVPAKRARSTGRARAGTQ
jgi:hypothetical protein